MRVFINYLYLYIKIMLHNYVYKYKKYCQYFYQNSIDRVLSSIFLLHKINNLEILLKTLIDCYIKFHCDLHRRHYAQLLCTLSKTNLHLFHQDFTSLKSIYRLIFFMCNLREKNQYTTNEKAKNTMKKYEIPTCIVLGHLRHSGDLLLSVFCPTLLVGRKLF